MSQKGFSSIIFILGILIISGLIVGISYLQKTNNTFLFKSPLLTSHSAPSNFIPSSQPLATNPTDSFKNKIVYVNSSINKSKKLKVSSPDGKNIQSFDPKLDQDKTEIKDILQSNDCKQIVVSQIDESSIPSDFYKDSSSANFNSLNLMVQKQTEILEGLPIKYYLYSIDGKLLKTINVDKIKKTLGDYKYIFFTGWSTDNNLIFSLLNSFSQNSDIKYGIYSIKTDEAKILPSKFYPLSTDYRYDPINQIFVDYDKNDNLQIKNFNNDQIKTISVNSNNTYKNASNFALNPNYIGDYVASILKDKDPNKNPNAPITFQVYSILNPDSPPLTIKTIYPHYGPQYDEIYWSPSYNYFSFVWVDYTSKDENHPSDTYLDGKLLIYNKSGNRVLDALLNDTLFKDNGYLPQRYDVGGIFSPDEKLFLLASSDEQDITSTKRFWREFDLSTGKLLINPYSSLDLGKPLCWY